MSLTEAEIEAIAAKIAEPIARLETKLDAALKALSVATSIRADMHVFNKTQAMAFINIRSSRNFYRWIEKFAPFSKVGNNRYSRAKLEIGRARELGGVK